MEAINKEEIINYLKDALSIEVKQENGFYGEKHTEIIIKLEGEVISSDSLDLN